jgi:hypothetical protein
VTSPPQQLGIIPIQPLSKIERHFAELLALFPQCEEDRKVLTLNEPQVWTVIGVFATALFGLLGFVTTSISRTIRTEIGSVRNEIGSLRGEMNARFDSLSSRIDHLDRDVQFLMKRELEDRA